MSDFKFISPSIKFAESDLTTVTQQIGLTSLGLVGEFPCGAAFTPIQIRDKNERKIYLGSESPELLNKTPKYLGILSANAFLEESNNLWVTRVLGLSGYDAGKGWALKVRGAYEIVSTIHTETVTNVTLNSNDYLESTYIYKSGVTTNQYKLLFKTKNTVGEYFLNVGAGEYKETDEIFFKNHIGEIYAIKVKFTIVSITLGVYVLNILYTTYSTKLKNSQIHNTITNVIRSRGNYINDVLDFRSDKLSVNNTFTQEDIEVTIPSSTKTVTTSQTNTLSITLSSVSTYWRPNTGSMPSYFKYGRTADEKSIYYEGLLSNGSNGVSITTSSNPILNLYVRLDFQEKAGGGSYYLKTITFKSVESKQLTINAIPHYFQKDVIKSYTENNSPIPSYANGGNITLPITPIVELETKTDTVETISASSINGKTISTWVNGRIDVDFSDNLIVGVSNLNPQNTTSTSIEVDDVVNVYEDFTIKAENTITNDFENYTVTLNQNNRNFITKVLGSSPFDKQGLIFSEFTYNDSLRKAVENNEIWGLYTEPIELDDFQYNDYNEQYKGAETPWIVSELRGNKLERLFKFYTISDGNCANDMIKISFNNINPDTKEFDIEIRDFYDTDDKPVILEKFSRCSMDKTLINYVGRRVGAIDETDNRFIYDRKSKYVYLVMNTEHSNDSFPAGFEGYFVKNLEYNLGCNIPQIEYKLNYNTLDKIRKVYLGISERGYDSEINNGKSINKDIFKYFGVDFSKLKMDGFHMDKDTKNQQFYDGSDYIGYFKSGNDSFKNVNDILDETNIYFDRFSRKFTLVPYNGFDGWDIYRSARTNSDAYRPGTLKHTPTNDYEAWLKAIKTFDNPEETEVNVFVTNGINWMDNSYLVKEALDMVEERADMFYVMDAPDIKGNTLAEEISAVFDIVDIDSSYAATYSPWIEKELTNGERIYMPPTGEVVRSYALTDNRTFPWFAPAGLNRGAIDARATRRKFKESERDVLYQNRINPIMDFNDVGVTIFGQKTTQRRESALDRINVRRMLLSLRKSIATIAKTLLFDQNDEIVREQFINKVTPILNNIKRERGLYDFKIVSDNLDPELLDRNEMNFKLMLKPTRSLEYIGISFVITPTGASFDDV